MGCPGIVDLKATAVAAAIIGILLPLAYVPWMLRYRNGCLVAMYAAVGGWSLLSCLLLVGIYTATAALYWIWIVYSLVFAPTMIVTTILTAVVFWQLKLRRGVVCPVLGVIFYILSIYFICVVNTHRQKLSQASSSSETYSAPSAGGGAGPLPGRAGFKPLPTHVLKATTRSVALAPRTNAVIRRERCAVPERDPPFGVYRAALPNDTQATRGQQYPRLQLWVFCDRLYRPRSLEYALCDSGGWSHPLPDCVRDTTLYDVRKDENNPDIDSEDKKPAPTGICALPAAPAHGSLANDAPLSPARMSVEARCQPLHFLVGYARVSCVAGVWDHPMPKCMFVDESVCPLPRLPRADGMTRTCLPGELYGAAYGCDAGLVPHGGVVEPRCPPGRSVPRPYPYMFCVAGAWHPLHVDWEHLRCQTASDAATMPDNSPTTSSGLRSRVSESMTMTSIYKADLFRTRLQFIFKPISTQSYDIWKPTNDPVKEQIHETGSFRKHLLPFIYKPDSTRIEVTVSYTTSLTNLNLWKPTNYAVKEQIHETDIFRNHLLPFVFEPESTRSELSESFTTTEAGWFRTPKLPFIFKFNSSNTGIWRPQRRKYEWVKVTISRKPRGPTVEESTPVCIWKPKPFNKSKIKRRKIRKKINKEIKPNRLKSQNQVRRGAMGAVTKPISIWKSQSQIEKSLGANLTFLPFINKANSSINSQKTRRWKIRKTNKRKLKSNIPTIVSQSYDRGEAISSKTNLISIWKLPSPTDDSLGVNSSVVPSCCTSTTEERRKKSRKKYRKKKKMKTSSMTAQGLRMQTAESETTGTISISKSSHQAEESYSYRPTADKINIKEVARS